MAKTLSNLPIGAKIKHPGSKYYGKDIIFLKIAENHPGYPQNSTTLLSEKILCLKASDAKEPKNSNGSRKSYGNNRYIHSNIKQWLNSSATSWYSAKHSADEPPKGFGVTCNPYDTEKGFMANLTTELRSAILPTSLKVLKDDKDGGGLESFTDKIFLLSCTEVGLDNGTSNNEGTKFDYFKSISDRVAYPTKEAIDNNTYTSDNLSTSKSWDWWLRTPHSSSSNPGGNVRHVYNVGSLGLNVAYIGYGGVRPALNLDSGSLVSDKPDSDGAYRLLFNRPSSISGKDEDLGNISDEINYKYTVFDEDNDTLSIVERLNNTVINVRNDVKSGTEFTLNIPKQDIYKLPIGQKNTISIEISDGTEKVYRNLTFVRTNTAPVIQILTKQDMGQVIDTFNTKIKVTDEEKDNVNLIYTLNKVNLDHNASFIRTEIHRDTKDKIALNTEIPYTIPKALFKTMNIGQYELSVKAIDAEQGENEEIITFSRTEDTIDFETKNIETDVMPKQFISLIQVVGNPKHSKIMACNNGLDAKPNWEDITKFALDGSSYTFKNTTKTAAKWAVKIKVNIDGKEVK